MLISAFLSLSLLLGQWSVGWWSRPAPADVKCKITFYPAGDHFSTVAELGLLVSVLSWEFLPDGP